MRSFAKNREINQLQDEHSERAIVAESAPASRPTHRHGRARRLVYWAAGTAGATLFLMMTAFGTVEQSPFPPRTDAVMRLLSPEVQVVDNASQADFIHEDRFQRGDTFAVLLNRLGVSDADVDRLLADRNALAPLRALRPGTSVQSVTGPDRELKSLSFLSGRDRLVGIEAAPEGFRTFARSPEVGRELLMKSGQVRSSLFAATDEAGVPDGVAGQLADIFGGEIDFHRDLRRGDHFTVVYEMMSVAGKPVRAGRVVAAEFTNRGKAYRAIWFDSTDAEGKITGAYYTPDGRSLKKAFLRSPLEFSRITSGFAMRFHPILQQWRAHQGIDYGAPTGTRVKATGDGVVEFAGREGGYGNLIILRHNGTYSTRYAHLSGFAPGLHKGTRVSQGDVIGFVGQTGLATGPHLHYEFRINNEYRNPLTLAFPDAGPIQPEQMAAFRAASAPLATRLDLLRNSNLALLE